MGGEINSVDCRWLSKVDRPPWIEFDARDCTRTFTSAIVAITSWKVDSGEVCAALISRSV